MPGDEICVEEMEVLSMGIEQCAAQLADHYDYAATLCQRIDNLSWVDAQYDEHLEERVTSLTARIAVHEQDTQENISMFEDFVECIRYGCWKRWWTGAKRRTCR